MNLPDPASAAPTTVQPDIGLCLNRALRRSSNKLRRFYDSALAPSGLRALEFGLLAVIVRTGTIGIVELADAFLFDRATLRYRLAPLERAGLVETLVDPRDKRSRKIGATLAGRAKLVEATELWEAAQGCVEALLGPETAASLRATADRLASSALPERLPA